MNIIQQLEKEQVEKLSAGKEIPDFEPGDTVLVNVKVVEGDAARVQAYEGVCIGRVRRRPERELHRAQDFLRRRRRARVPALFADDRARSRSCAAARCAAPSSITCAVCAARRPASPRPRAAGADQRRAEGSCARNNRRVASPSHEAWPACPALFMSAPTFVVEASDSNWLYRGMSSSVSIGPFGFVLRRPCAAAGRFFGRLTAVQAGL